MTDLVLSCEVDLHGARYDKIEDRVRFAEQLADRASRLPGVTASGITTKLPLEGGSNLPILVNSEVFDPKVNRPLTEASSITPGYFTAAGIRLLRGRTLERDDAGQETIGVVVNRTLADTCWPGSRICSGRSFGAIPRSPFSTPGWWEWSRACGSGGRRRSQSRRSTGRSTEPGVRTDFLLVRSSQPAASLAPLLKRELSGLDKDLPMSHGRVKAMAGALLHLKPVIRVDTDGKYSTVTNARTIGKGMSAITEYLYNTYANAPLWVTVLHGRFADKAEELSNELKEKLNIAKLEVMRISPVLGVHTGPSVVGAAVVPVEVMDGLM